MRHPSRGDRYLSHSSRHTQVPVPATTHVDNNVKTSNKNTFFISI